MNENPTDAPRAGFEVRMTSDSHFGWLRTRMSTERTLMSWVRTSIGLIGFGFTIVQFLARLQEVRGAEVLRPDAPRYLGLAMIAAGVVAMAISAWQYRSINRYLTSGSFAPLAGLERERPVHTPVFGISVVVILIGLFAFGAVYYRMT